MEKRILESLENYKEYTIDLLEGNNHNYMLTARILRKISNTVESYMAYENNDASQMSVGIGEYVSFVVYKNKIIVTQKGRCEEIPVQNLSEDLAKTFHMLNVKDWRVYGIANFNYAKNTFLKNVSEEDRLLELFIPNIDIRIDNEKIKVRYLSQYESIISTVEECLADQSEWKFDTKKIDENDVKSIKEIDADYYKDIVARAVKEINANQYEKVILSRKINLNHRIAMVDSYVEGRKYNTPARSYCIKLKDSEIFGFSPETVAEVADDRTVYTFPLAGTRALTENQAVNKHLKEELLRDPKEIAEHAVSVKLAYEELEQVCEEKSVSVIRFMDVLERGTVQHLASRLKGDIKPELNEWHAFTALFPAVTASGIPKKECIDAIDRLEKDERGLYSGGVLVYDADGTLDVALVLRTAFQNQNETWVRVGAGIVKLSNPERELEETREKVGSIINRLIYE